MTDIEFRQLRYFVVVAEELNFTRAAERLQISQPPLSRQIQSLETALSVALLERTKRQVRLTPAGEVFLDKSRQLLRQLDLSVQATQRVARGETGRLVIGFEGTDRNGTVLQAIQAFRAQYPDVEFVLREMTSKQQLEALGDRRIDIGFIELALATDEVTTELLPAEPLVAVLPTQHPLAQQEQLTLSQLATEPWITGRSDTGCGLLVRILEACAQAGFTPQVKQETNDVNMMLDLVGAGLGVTLLPRSIHPADSPSVIARPLGPTPPTVHPAIAWNPMVTHTATLSAFLQTVRAIGGPSA